MNMASDEVVPLWHRDDAIKSWQSATSVGNEGITSIGIIGSLFDCIMGVLRYLLEDLYKRRLAESPQSESRYETLESISASLFFWGLDFGVSRGDLDETLQQSDMLRETVLLVLVSIGEHTRYNLISVLTTLERGREILDSSNIDTVLDHAKIVLDGPENTEDATLGSIEQTFQALQTKVENLGILSSSLECPAEDRRDVEAARAWTESQDRAADQYYVDLVGHRFPLAEKALVERLGRSNWNRYRHVQEKREYVQQEPEVLTTEQPKSEFHDSGIGSSGPARSAFAPNIKPILKRPQSEDASSVVSSRAEASHKRLPPLPEKARSGEPFICEVCNKSIRIHRTMEWKRHVFKDICAYTCLFIECSSAGVLFEDREVMMSHMELEHGINQNTASQLCPLCLDKIQGGRDVIVLHFSRHLEEVALAILPTSAGSDTESDGSESDTQDSGSDIAITSATLPGNMTHEATDPEAPEEIPEGKNSRLGTRKYLKCNVCGTIRIRACDMKKHMKRHRKPYACTYYRCNKKFGAMSDWKRHEISQHFQLEAYSCGLSSSTMEVGERCGAYFLSQEEFRKHLESQHRMTDPEAAANQIKRRRIGKNGQSQFWCGFCQDLILLRTKRIEAWDERFNHISYHFIEESRTTEEWLCVESNRFKGLIEKETTSKGWEEWEDEFKTNGPGF